MAHRNREKRAERRAREAEKRRVLYDEYDDDDYDDDDEDEDDYEPRRAHPAVTAIVTVAIIAVLLYGGYRGYYWLEADSLKPVDVNDSTEIVVIVSEGDGAVAISKTLMDRGILKGGLIRGYITEYFFKKYCEKMEYKDFKFGEYTLRKNMTVDEIAAIMMKGIEVAPTKWFTIPEGLTIGQVAKSLAEQGIISEWEFYAEVRGGDYDYPFLKDCPPGDNRLEGFLYPDTYQVYEDATARDVVSKMLDEFDRHFVTEYYARLSDLDMSVRDIVTLASIIERESVKAEERPIMAGVFFNRLDIGMMLESCATVQYIFISRGEEAKEYLTIEDTQTPSEYNTYLIEGLPPGPICNPRIESIEAALYPETHDFIFFVLSDALDGSHKFSVDLAEHEKNKAAYYAAVEGR